MFCCKIIKFMFEYIHKHFKIKHTGNIIKQQNYACFVHPIAKTMRTVYNSGHNNTENNTNCIKKKPLSMAKWKEKLRKFILFILQILYLYEAVDKYLSQQRLSYKGWNFHLYMIIGLSFMNTKIKKVWSVLCFPTDKQAGHLV